MAERLGPGGQVDYLFAVQGIPNVTSSIGVEAMHGNLEWNGFIEDSEKSFTEKGAELYQNEEIWNKSRESGYQILEKIFSCIKG